MRISGHSPRLISDGPDRPSRVERLVRWITLAGRFLPRNGDAQALSCMQSPFDSPRGKLGIRARFGCYEVSRKSDVALGPSRPLQSAWPKIEIGAHVDRDDNHNPWRGR
jgi:hypothetical protein